VVDLGKGSYMFGRLLRIQKIEGQGNCTL